MESRRVVVTGLGAVTPIGNSVPEFWQSLREGKNGIGEISYFDTSDSKAKLDAEVKNFDARNYLSKIELLRSDKYTHYAIAASDEAIKDSGVIGTLPPERIAVYFATGIGGIETFQQELKKMIDRGPGRVSPYFVPMMISNMASGMIAIRNNCQGPAMPQVTACASGSNAIGEALRLIRHGYADACITGGSEAAICKIGVAGFTNMQALSTATDINAASIPFDKRRAGFVIGEGAGALVLEEYEHAVRRGAPILAEVCGYGFSSNGGGISQPSDDGSVIAIRRALDAAGMQENIRMVGSDTNMTIKTNRRIGVDFHFLFIFQLNSRLCFICRINAHGFSIISMRMMGRNICIVHGFLELNVLCRCASMSPHTHRQS